MTFVKSDAIDAANTWALGLESMLDALDMKLDAKVISQLRRRLQDAYLKQMMIDAEIEDRVLSIRDFQ